MFYQEKKSIVSISSSLLLMFIYAVAVLSKYNSETNASDLKFWSVSILSFIGISIILQIIIQIIFHILLSISIAIKERNDDEKFIEKKIKLEMIEDERDQLIELKSLRIGYVVTCVGILFALLSLVIEYPPAIMLNIVFLSCMLGTIFEGFVQLFYYRKNQ